MSARVVIVEGTCGSGKSTLLRAASTIFDGLEVSVLMQNATYAPIAEKEDNGTLDDASNRRALIETVRGIRAEAVAGRRIVLVDTLHATHLVRAGALTLKSFAAIDRALCDLGALVVVLRVDMETIRTRTIVGRRGTGFYEYAKKFGATEDERTLYFVREQERLIDLLLTHSRLPQVVLDGCEPRESLHARFRSVVDQHFDT